MQTNTRLAQIIERLTERIKRESADAPAAFVQARDVRINDGARYDFEADTRPDFVKADDPPGLRRGRFR